QWTTNEASDSQVEYGLTASYGSATTLNPALRSEDPTSELQSPDHLIYHHRVKSKDAAGNLATSGDSTFTTLDTTPPVISGVTATSITPTSATIQWTTNEASDSQVEYGLTSSYGSATTLNAALVTAHSMLVSGLTSSTAYHYRVDSRDASGNLATSADFTFATSVLDTTPPTVSISSPPDGATVAG